MGSVGQIPACGSLEKNQVSGHFSATDSCCVFGGEESLPSTVNRKSTEGMPSASAGITNVIVPVRGTAWQSSSVKRRYQALGQMVACDPMAFQLRVTLSPGSLQIGVTSKEISCAGAKAVAGRGVAGRGVSVADILGGVLVIGAGVVSIGPTSFGSCVEGGSVVAIVVGAITVGCGDSVGNSKVPISLAAVMLSAVGTGELVG